MARNPKSLGTPAPLIALIAALTVGTSAWSAPAAWYLWRSTQNDYNICSQISPGPGWRAVKGPFQDAQCKKKGTPRGSF